MAEDRTCTIPGCRRRHLARSWCAVHYARWRRTGTPQGAPRTRQECEVPSCRRLRDRGRLCAAHNKRRARFGDPELTARTNIDGAVVDLAVMGFRPRALTLGERQAAVRELHRQGLSDPRIAARVGMSACGVCLMRKRMGLPANRRPAWGAAA